MPGTHGTGQVAEGGKRACSVSLPAGVWEGSSGDGTAWASSAMVGIGPAGVQGSSSRCMCSCSQPGTAASTHRVVRAEGVCCRRRWAGGLARVCSADAGASARPATLAPCTALPPPRRVLVLLLPACQPCTHPPTPRVVHHYPPRCVRRRSRRVGLWWSPHVQVQVQCLFR